MFQRRSLQKAICLGAILGSLCFSAFGEEKRIAIYLLNTDKSTYGIGKQIGHITFKDTEKGLEISPDLKGLPPGEHGFHVHENPSCKADRTFLFKLKPGLSAGGHLDPQHTHTHLGPYHKGHLGDLPILVVNEDGEASKKMFAPRLTVSDITGHSVIIHEGGDNYADQPPLGGGGARIACGIISKESDR